MDNSKPGTTPPPTVDATPLQSSADLAGSFPPNPDPVVNPDAPSIPVTEAPPVIPSSISNSPLDNPWGAPPQQPASPLPTWVPPATTTNLNPAEQALPNSPISSIQPNPPLPTNIQSEPAPTDLSHLISNNTQSAPQDATSVETLVVPSQNSGSVAEVPNVPTENHKGIPKWLIGVGVGLLIIVIGASAYFILGIGQRQQTTTSIPAQISQPTVATPPPVTTPVVKSDTQTSTESAGFGQLEGNSQPQQASSAADILKQRQQQAR